MEKASSLWQDFNLDTEESLVPSCIMGKDLGNRQGQGMSSAQPKQKSSKPAKVAAAVVASPLVIASRQRARTAKPLADAERSLERARLDSQKLLQVTAPSICPGKAEDDPTLDLISSRLDMVMIALNDRGGAESEQASRDLYAAAMRDPYLRDCQDTLLSDPAAVQTLGAIKYCRKFKMDLFRGCGNRIYFFDV